MENGSFVINIESELVLENIMKYYSYLYGYSRNDTHNEKIPDFIYFCVHVH